MTTLHKSGAPAQYRIKLNERIDDKWTNWFEEMVISFES